MPQSSVRRLLKFIRIFGLAGGIRLWCSMQWQMTRHSTLLELSVPGLPPMHLRPNDLPIFWQIMVMRENDFQLLPQSSRVNEIYRSILSEGNKPVIVDCGGHIGLSAIWFASRFPEATVYTVEPDASNYAMLKRNTAAYPNVIPLNGGIWNRSCRLEISNPHSGSASFRLQEVPDTAENAHLLRGYSVDEIFRGEPANRLLLVKMDIEGAEAQVFQGPTEWLEFTSVLVIELHDWLMPGQGTSRNFFKRLAENPFDVVLRGENLLLFRIPELDETATPPQDAQMLVARP